MDYYYYYYYYYCYCTIYYIYKISNQESRLVNCMLSNRQNPGRTNIIISIVIDMITINIIIIIISIIVIISIMICIISTLDA